MSSDKFTLWTCDICDGQEALTKTESFPADFVPHSGWVTLTVYREGEALFGAHICSLACLKRAVIVTPWEETKVNLHPAKKIFVEDYR